jgi:putative ABC transport system ATP-binding protein
MLRVEHIVKIFNRGTVNEKKALGGLSLTLEPGDFATVVGSNGAGKSTLFNAIAGSFYVDEGSIYLDGEDITFLPEHKRSRSIGRMFQDPLRGTAPRMTIEENLALAALCAPQRRGFALRGITKKDRAYLRDYLVLLGMGLEDRMKQPVGLLSGGQRQAMTLLMATVITPKLLLLDEHTAALDPAAAENILRLTREIVTDRGLTCLMVTHNMKHALEMGNRTLMMNAGAIVLDIRDPEREGLTVGDLLERFRLGAGKAMDDDRVLLSETESGEGPA